MENLVVDILPAIRFEELWTALGARGHGGDVFLRLRSAYDEQHRAYHTAGHISACLRLLDDPEVLARIAAHVRATKDHATDSADGQLLIDIDLSILGESAEVFARFEEEIRREYAWVEVAVYVAGRAAVLRRFGDRPFIYGTPLLRDRYEARARANIAASLRKLGADRPA